MNPAVEDGPLGHAAATPPAAVRRVLDALDLFLNALAVFCLVAIAALTFAGVVSRYVFAASLTWTGEAAQWLFIYLIFLGIPLAHRQRLHLSIGAVERLLPEGLKRAHQVAVDALVAYVTIAMLFGARDIIGMIGGTSAAMALPGWLQYAGIPASCVFGLVYLALRDLDRERDRWFGAAGAVLGAGLYAAVDALPAGDPAVVMPAVFVGAMLLGVPVAFAMLLAVFAVDLSAGVLPAPAIVQNIVRGSGQFLLLAIPLFLLAGALMNVGGLTQRLIDFAYTLVRHLRAGFAQVTVVSATLYAGISGSSNADAALSAKMLYPAMLKDGYRAPFSAAVCAASAVLPNIIPPSVGMLIISAATGISVGQMFVAGIVPGLLYAAALMLAVWLVARRHGYRPSAPRASLAERWRAGKSAIPVMLLAVFIIASLRLGIATPTETGAIAVAYAFVLGVFVFRAYTARDLWGILSQTAVDSALIGLLIGAAVPFGFVLTTERVPQAVLEFASGALDGKFVVLLFVNAVMIFAGMFLDIGAAILILSPLFLPLVAHVGVDPVHFGVIVICNLMIGGLTPPVGILAYIVSTVTKLPVMPVFGALLPFLGALLLALAAVTFVPGISLGLLWLIG
jgi:tripartite ATP-independent transporter DctM subunit